MGLPFKPHVVASVAKEIDASIYSHNPLEYRLRTIAVSKPDYSDLISRHRFSGAQAQDPRLRRYSSSSSSSTAAAASASSSAETSYNPGRDLAPKTASTGVKRRDPRRRD